MKIGTLILATAVALSPAISVAQGLVPTMNSEYEFCQERPPEPDWMQNLHVRESYKRRLVQSIYQLEGYQRVSEASDCSCDTLYPPWDNAVQRFNDNYLHLERRDAMDTRRDFQDQANTLRRSLRDLCEPIGHW